MFHVQITFDYSYLSRMRTTHIKRTEQFTNKRAIVVAFVLCKQCTNTHISSSILSLTHPPLTRTHWKGYTKTIFAHRHMLINIHKYTTFKYFMLCVLIVHSSDCLCRRGRKREEFQENFCCCLERVKFTHAQLF